MDPLEILEVRLAALAGDATEAQQHALTSWVIQEVAIDDWRHAANMVIEYLGDKSGDIYTDITMRLGEMGM